MRLRPRLILVALLLTGLLNPRQSMAQEDVPSIAAASSIQFALTETIQAFHDQTGRVVQATYGSSGNFVRQIRQGAPFEMFLSADEKCVLDLTADGLTQNDGDIYATGRLVIMVPHGSPLVADGTLEDVRTVLADGRLGRFAIANPEHAPYGARAKEALSHAGLWDAIQDRLVFGENIAQTAQFATSGNAEGGLIAYSLALSPTVAPLGTFQLIAESWHTPLQQRMVLLKDAGETARIFYDFVKSPAGQAILAKHGFAAP
ncbi:MAG: molybdate ABC transporter substrate-binding protein [Pseudomonadota bacterium]